MRTMLMCIALFGIGLLAGCGEDKKATIPTTFAPPPTASTGGAGAQPAKNDKTAGQPGGAAKVEQ
jgi:hypothetical protein